MTILKLKINNKIEFLKINESITETINILEEDRNKCKEVKKHDKYDKCDKHDDCDKHDKYDKCDKCDKHDNMKK